MNLQRGVDALIDALLAGLNSLARWLGEVAREWSASPPLVQAVGRVLLHWLQQPYALLVAVVVISLLGVVWARRLGS